MSPHNGLARARLIGPLVMCVSTCAAKYGWADPRTISSTTGTPLTDIWVTSMLPLRYPWLFQPILHRVQRWFFDGVQELCCSEQFRGRAGCSRDGTVDGVGGLFRVFIKFPPSAQCQRFSHSAVPPVSSVKSLNALYCIPSSGTPAVIKYVLVEL